MTKENIPALTGLRFFAAMAIFLWHSQTGYFFNYGAFSPFTLLGAVPVFFVLSGLVLTINYNSYCSWPDFFVARIARVWPAHMTALICLFLVFYPYSMDFFHHEETVIQLIINVLLLQSWSSNVATYWSYNSPSWSVSCELFFYAIFPLLFLALSRQTLWRIWAIVIVIFIAIIAVDKIHPKIDTFWLGVVNPVSAFVAFAVGVTAGVYRKRCPTSKQHGLVGGSIIQSIALVLALAANVYFGSYHAVITPAADLALATYGPTPFYAALLLALARYDGWLSRGLSYPIIVYGGEISYSIYLFHQIFIRWHSTKLQVFNSVPIWCQYLGILTATLVTAAVVHRLVEQPARRWMLAGWKRAKATYAK